MEDHWRRSPHPASRSSVLLLAGSLIHPDVFFFFSSLGQRLWRLQGGVPPFRTSPFTTPRKRNESSTKTLSHFLSPLFYILSRFLSWSVRQPGSPDGITVGFPSCQLAVSEAANFSTHHTTLPPPAHHLPLISPPSHNCASFCSQQQTHFCPAAFKM